MAYKTGLTDAQMALIISKLQMPLVARDHIDAGAELDVAAKYGLHEIMSDFTPDMALLCAALTLQEIACCTPGLTYLLETSVHIVADYAAEGEKDLYKLAGDLEQILELMEICRMSFEILKPEALVFLDIMIPQIQAQTMIVDEAIKLRGDQDLQMMGSENVVSLFAPV